MSDTLKCNNPICERPKSLKEVKDDISMSETKQEHIRHSVFYWFILILAIIFILSIAVLFIYKVFTDSQIQTYIIDQIKNNIVFIIVTSLAILKINIPSSTN